MASELESHQQETVYWGRKKLVNFKAGKPNLFCLSGLITLVLFDVKRDGYLLEENLYFEIFWDYLSLLNYIDAFTLSLLLKLSPKKIGALIRSLTCLSSEAALYLYKPTIQP